MNTKFNAEYLIKAGAMETLALKAVLERAGITPQVKLQKDSPEMNGIE
jgi:hypothetical protein